MTAGFLKCNLTMVNVWFVRFFFVHGDFVRGDFVLSPADVAGTIFIYQAFVL